MSATKVLDLAESQGLLDAKVIGELRRQVAESRFVVTPEALAKVLVDHGHLTPFQARKLVASAMGAPPPESEQSPAAGSNGGGSAPVPKKSSPPAAKSKHQVPEEFTLADDEGDIDSSLPSAIPTAELDDDVVPLEPVESSPAPPPPRSKDRDRSSKQPKPVAPSDLEPIDLPPTQQAPPRGRGQQTVAAPVAAAPPVHELTPLPTLEEVYDPLSTGDAALMGAPPAPQPRRKKSKGNVWDSPLLLIGGGLLGVLLIAMVVLWYVLTSGSAAEFYAKVDEEYEKGQYAAAIEHYQDFVEKYPKDPNVSMARVRRVLAELHQVTDGGRTPKQALSKAKELLPTIESEEKFGEARIELSTMLPDIADGFATQAAEAATIEQKQELVKLANEALTLVNNPAYIPATLRRDRESRITAIIDKLKAAERGIQQDQDLAAAVAKINEAAEKGDAAAAYQIRGTLLKSYPGLENNERLVAAIRAVGDKERQLVQVSSDAVAATAEDTQPSVRQIVLATRQGPMPAAEVSQAAYLLLEGAVYAIDVQSGRILWRRHVGYETTTQPLPISKEAAADALVSDAARHALFRLEARTGKVLWRQVLGQSFATPVIAGDSVFVTTRAGRVLQIAAGDGSIVRSAQLPQTATTSSAIDSRQSRLVQLGQHSTLFLLAADSLECVETFYFGHKAGAILVPPISVLDLVVVTESPTDDHSVVHVLMPGEKDQRLARAGRGFRLRGRVVVPLSVAGRRFAVMTDLGQVAVFEVDSANRQQPVRQVAGLEASERSPQHGYYTMDANRLWVATRRCSLFEIQSSVQQLSRRWTMHQDDAFVAPLQIHENTLIHSRRRPGSPAVVVEGCQATDGQTIWTTHVAAPVVGIAGAEARKAIAAITQEGNVFELTADDLRAGLVESPTFANPNQNSSILPAVNRSLDNTAVCYAESRPDGRVFAFDVAAGSRPATIALSDAGDEVIAPVVYWNKNVLAPLASGKVALLDPTAGKEAMLPFMPPLSPDSLPVWTSPAVLPDQSGFVIGDGRGKLYRVIAQNQPQPHLAAAAEVALQQELYGKLAATEDTIYGVAKSQAGDVIVAFDAQSLAQQQQWPLQGKALTGPDEIDGAVFISSEADGLFCLESGQKLRWQQPLKHGPLAGAPQVCDGGDLLLVYQSGHIARIAADSGEELAAADAGQALGGASRVAGSQVFLAASDGSILLVPLPKRP